MKRNKNLKLGFTMMEMLITMLITTLVAAAMVPVIGLKKVKIPVNRYNNGIAECYYEQKENGSWQLMYYYADNKGRRNATPVPVEGNYCTFDAPDSSYVEIIAIGPGTDAYDETIPSIALSNAPASSSYIRVDSNYQKDIKSAMVQNAAGEQKSIANFVRQALNEWASSERKDELFARYNAVSPVGKGGDGMCTAQSTVTESKRDKCLCASGDEECDGGTHILESQYNNYLYDSTTCWVYIDAAGSDSGKGVRTYKTIQLPLSGNSNISTFATKESAGVYVDGNGLTLLASGAGQSPTPQEEYPFFKMPSAVGRDARCEGNLCTDAKVDFNGSFNKGASTGEENGFNNECLPGLGDSAISGKVYFGEAGDKNPSKLKWTYDSVVADVTAGGAGSKGEENTVLYENLKGKIYLMPALSASNGDDVYTYVRENPNDASTTIVQAKAGSSFGSQYTIKFDMKSSDMPYPAATLDAAIPENEFGYIAKLSATPYNAGLKRCNSWCPGFAGKGQYFFFNDIPDLSALTIENLYKDDAKYTVPISKLLVEQKVEVETNLCSDGSTSPTSLGTKTYTSPATGKSTNFEAKYCQEPSKYGHPGAVIIMW